MSYLTGTSFAIVLSSLLFVACGTSQNGDASLKGDEPSPEIKITEIKIGDFTATKVSVDGRDVGTYLEAGKAKTWNEARDMCANLKAPGSWRLLTAQDYMNGIFVGAAKAVSQPVAVSGSADKPDHAYMAWIYDDTGKRNQVFEDSDKVFSIADGRGFAEDISSLAEIMGHLNEARTSDQVPAEVKPLLEKNLEELKDGLKVVCVPKS